MMSARLYSWAARLATVMYCCFLTPFVVSSQPPPINPAFAHRQGVLNEVCIQLVPDAYYAAMAGDPRKYGAEIARLSVVQDVAGTPQVVDTIQMGDEYTNRTLFGSWTGVYPVDPLVGSPFRFTLEPPASPPHNRHASVMLRPPAGFVRLDVTARNLRDFNSSIPDTHLSVWANGAHMGAFTMSPGWSTYGVSMAGLKDRFLFQLSGQGTVTITEMHLYNAAGQAVRSVTGLSLAVTAGAAPVAIESAYAGPVTDCALRVNAGGVADGSRLLVSNSAEFLMALPVTPNSTVLTSEDTDVLRRTLNERLAYPAESPPTPATSRVLWSDDMRIYPVGWSVAAAPGASFLQDDRLVVEVPSSTNTFMYVNLPSPVAFGTYRYLAMRVRASLGAIYYIRPSLDGVSASVDMTPPIALEQRKGRGTDEAGWETVTFNLNTLQQLYSPPASSANRVAFVVAPDLGVASRPATLRMEVDWIGLHAGLTPDALAAQETHFSDSLDNDGDGLVDRDDENYRLVYPPAVFANYHSFWGALARGGFGGQRLSQQGGAPITIDPYAFSSIPGKRHIRSTYYPLDFVRNPAYVPPAYNEFYDQNSQGIWNPCSAPGLPPTEQFRTLDYGVYGAIEEYDVESPSWATAEAELARRYNIDGFVYNDCGLDDFFATERPITVMGAAIGAKAATDWADKPFRMASFYTLGATLSSTPGANTVQAAIDNLSYMGKRRASEVLSWARFQGKPLLFVYPMDVVNNHSVQDWRSILQGLLNPGALNYHGAVSAPAAVAGPAAANMVTFTFTAYNLYPTGNADSGLMDQLLILDRNMKTVGTVDFGTAAARAQLLEGWGPDQAATAAQNWSSAWLSSAAGAPPGVARMTLTLPPDACYLLLRMFGLGTSAGAQQYCELRINTTGGTPAASFATKLGWYSYLLRLRNLPAGFTMSGVVEPPLAELPFSIWGESQELVRPRDAAVPNTSQFDGFASYAMSAPDSRVEVSYPYLNAFAVRPGFDDSGFYYYCSGTRTYFVPRNGVQRYRTEWEWLVNRGPDIAIVTSWNEFGEGTNIHPDIEHGYLPLQITQTYALLFKGVFATVKPASATNFVVWRHDATGTSRETHFSIGSPDTVRLRQSGFGAAGQNITGILRDGVAVALGSAEAAMESGAVVPTLRINAPAGGTYVVRHNSSTLSADLSVSLTDAPDPVPVGSALTYTMRVTNHGPNAANGITLTAPLAAGTSFQSAVPSQGTAAHAGGVVTVQLASLASGASATVNVVVVVNVTGAIAASASVSAVENDPAPGNNAANASTTAYSDRSADLSVAKTAGAGTVMVGDALTYTMTVTNHGPNAAERVVVTDTLPSLVAYTSSQASQGTSVFTGGVLTANLGDLAAGATATVQLVVAASGQGNATNTAHCSSTVYDPVSANNAASVSTNIVPRDGPDLVGQWTGAAGQSCSVSRDGVPRCTLRGTLAINNVGNRDAARSSVTFVLSRDAVLDGGDQVLKTQSVGKAGVGRSVRSRLSFRLPSGQSAAGWYVIAVLDSGGVVAETSESNNHVVSGPVP